MSLYARTMNGIRRGNNNHLPIQPKPWLEENEKPEFQPQPEPPEPEPALEPEPAPAALAEASPEPESEPEPVPLAKTFEALNDFLSEYLDCSDHQRTILALWIVHTYCFEIFPATPYLNIYSPEKQSGKTLCMKLLRLLSRNSWMPAGGLTATRLMEGIVQRRPALLLDDWHTAFRITEAQSIIGFLNAGCTEDACYSIRTEEKDAYCPKAFAGSSTLPASLADRSIPILLQRCKRSELPRPFCRAFIDEDSAPLVDQISRWFQDEENRTVLCQHAADLLLTDLPEFTPRQRECVIPLLTIARLLGPKWYRRARVALLRAFGIYTGSDLSTGTQLLQDIRAFFLSTGKPRIFTAELLDYLNELKERPWSRDRKGKPIHPNSLRNHLRHFGICPSYNQWINKQERKGFSVTDFTTAWECYLPAASLAHNSGVTTLAREVVETSPEVVETTSEVVENCPEVVEKASEVVENNAEVVESFPSRLADPVDSAGATANLMEGSATPRVIKRRPPIDGPALK